jgi:hypothetical protein
MLEKIVLAIIAALFILVTIIIVGLVGLLVAFLIVWLWNMSMPQLFGLPMITYWQAWSLYLLVMIFASLFKSDLKKE